MESLCYSVNTLCSYSEAYFGSGTKVTVLDPSINVTAPTVKVLKPSDQECKDKQENKKKKTLVCVAADFYPDHVSVTWKVSGSIRTRGVGTDTLPRRNEHTQRYSITSRLRVPAREWYDPTNTFECTVNFTGTPYQAEVRGQEEDEGEDMSAEEYLKINLTAKLAYGMFIAKSSFYGLFVLFLVWRLRGSCGKTL